MKRLMSANGRAPDLCQFGRVKIILWAMTVLAEVRDRTLHMFAVCLQALFSRDLLV